MKERKHNKAKGVMRIYPNAPLDLCEIPHGTRLRFIRTENDGSFVFEYEMPEVDDEKMVDAIRLALTMTMAQGRLFYGCDITMDQAFAWLEGKKAKTTVLPELRESEDERIRQSLIKFLTDIKEISESGRRKWAVREDDAEMCKSFLAYLEKQQENPKSADSIPSDCVSDAKCGNSQHKVEDSPEGRKLADEVVAYLIKSGYQPIIKDTLDQKHFQIKIPRHKEDFFHSKEYKHCREILDEYYYEGDFAGDVYTLYVLRQKEQKPAEMGEEDEKNYNRIIRFLEPHKTFFPTKETKEEMQNWIKNRLKSLRPSWKPSKEQMSMLLAVINDPNNAGSESCYLALKSIYNQLKKL